MCNEKLYYKKSLIYHTGNFQIAVSRSFMFMKIFCTHLITESRRIYQFNFSFGWRVGLFKEC